MNLDRCNGRKLSSRLPFVSSLVMHIQVDHQFVNHTSSHYTRYLIVAAAILLFSLLTIGRILGTGMVYTQGSIQIDTIDTLLTEQTIQST